MAQKAEIDLSNCTKPYVTETYVNGSSWYRVWSDGWCEQGGVTGTGGLFITFLKAYQNNNFIFTFQRHYLSNSSAYTNDSAGASRTTVAGSTQYGSTNGIGVYLDITTENGCNGARWRACGYIN